VSGERRRIGVPNFIIPLQRYCDFSNFQKGICHHLGFLKSWKFYWLFGWRGSRRISMPNFVKIGHQLRRYFSIWRPPPCWIFKFVKFYWLTVSGGPRRITVPNFVKIGRSVAEILRYFEFSRWPPPPSWIVRISKFYCFLGWRGSRHINVPNFMKMCYYPPSRTIMHQHTKILLK